jgi:nonsense-mediated mRNA decay protein 3
LLQEDDKARMDYERFLEELEEDPDMRAKVALYKDPTYVEKLREEDTMTETDGEEPPQVPLEELLDELTLEGEDDDEDEEMEG